MLDCHLIFYLCLMFRLPCSPCLLMLALYKILVVDSDNESPDVISDRKLIYDLSYMDNCSYTCNNEVDLRNAYTDFNNVFPKYNFSLQQFITNSVEFQNEIDNKIGKVTPDEVKLLGLMWDRKKDTLMTRKFTLDNNFFYNVFGFSLTTQYTLFKIKLTLEIIHFL